MRIKFAVFTVAVALAFCLLPVCSAAQTLFAAREQDEQRGLQIKKSWSVAKWPGKEKRFALIIGIDQYQDSQISKLEGASNDAKKLAAALIQYAGFPAEQVTLLTSEQPLDKWPTRAKILSRLSIMRALVARDGLLLIAFAGHGIERNKQAYLLPMDAQINGDVELLEDTAINAERMRNLIADTGAQQVVLIIDACRNDPVAGRGDSDNKLTDAYVKGFDFKERNQGITSFVTLFATKVGARAYESRERRQGYFSWALVEGLAGKAANEKGEVTLGGLVSYLQEIVPRRTALELGEGKKQQPYSMIEGYKADELVISVVPAKASGSGAPAAKTREPLPTPAEILRSTQTIAVRSKSQWFKASYVESELRKRPEFAALGLNLVSDKQKADILVELDRPLFTYTYTFNLIHIESSIFLAGGRVAEKDRSSHGSNAAPKIAEQIITFIREARTPPAAKPNQ